jgi:hypothetical protein
MPQLTTLGRALEFCNTCSNITPAAVAAGANINVGYLFWLKFLKIACISGCDVARYEVTTDVKYMGLLMQYFTFHAII